MTGVKEKPLRRSKKVILTTSQAEWYRLAMHVLAMPRANGYARQIASRCLRNCLTRNNDRVLGVSLASVELVRAGGKPERDHVLPLKMATAEMHSQMSQQDWHNMLERYRGVCLVTRKENVMLNKIPCSEDWRSRYALAGIEVVSPASYSSEAAAAMAKLLGEAA